jgi:hypothetical protein
MAVVAVSGSCFWQLLQATVSCFCKLLAAVFGV